MRVTHRRARIRELGCHHSSTTGGSVTHVSGTPVTLDSGPNTYKGGEQEESQRLSLLQRRGVRRDVREYNKLGEGGGEVGAAHER